MLKPFHFFAFVFFSVFAGCGTTQLPIAGLESPDKLMVYSLDPTPSEADTKEEKLGKYRVLGKVVVKDSEERKAIAAAIQDAVSQPDGTQKKCFDPRHAVVVVEKGKTLEIIICFKCRNYSLNGQGITPAIGRQPKEKLNAILRNAGVELAPEPSTP